MGNRYTSSTNDNGRSFLKPFPRPHAPPEFPDLLDWPDDVAGWLVDADDGGGLALPPALRQRLRDGCLPFKSVNHRFRERSVDALGKIAVRPLPSVGVLV